MFIEVIASLSRRLPYFRGKARLLEAITPPSGMVKGKVFGCPMELDLGDLIQRQIFLGYYEHGSLDRVKAELRPGATFVDVGANVGVFTALASRYVGPAGRVLAFEPSPYAFQRLNRAIHGRTNVQAFNIGLSEREGELVLFIPPKAAGNHDPSVVEYCAGMDRIIVPRTTLAKVLLENKVEQVDLLKIDVEGHEPEVFAGCFDVLCAGNIKVVLCEFNDPILRLRGTSAPALLQYLFAAGFTCDAFPMLDGAITNLILRHRSGLK